MGERFEEHLSFGGIMGEPEKQPPPSSIIPLVFGILFIAQTFVYIPWPSPWQSSFTTGVIGLFGCFFLYQAWFRETFETRGLLPTTNLWKNPASSVPQVAGVGLAFTFLSWASGNSLSQWMPKPAGMVLLLVGLLTMLVSGYAWLVLLGPLKEDGTQESE